MLFNIKEVHFKVLQEPMFYVITGIIALVVALVFFFIGVAFRKSKAEKTIGSAEKKQREYSAMLFKMPKPVRKSCLWRQRTRLISSEPKPTAI